MARSTHVRVLLPVCILAKGLENLCSAASPILVLWLLLDCWNETSSHGRPKIMEDTSQLSMKQPEKITSTMNELFSLFSLYSKRSIEQRTPSEEVADGPETMLRLCGKDLHTFSFTSSAKNQSISENPDESFVDKTSSEDSISENASGERYMPEDKIALSMISTVEPNVGNGIQLPHDEEMIAHPPVGTKEQAMLPIDACAYGSDDQQEYYTSRLRVNAKRLQDDISQETEDLLKSLTAPPLTNNNKPWTGLPCWIIVFLVCFLPLLIAAASHQLALLLAWHREQLNLYNEHQHLYTP